MGRKPKFMISSLKQEEEVMATTGEHKEEVKQIEDIVEQPTVNPHNVRHAYSLIENEGKYHVVSVEFDPNKLVAGKVKKIESHTEKFIMQERLQVLLLGDDLI